MAGHIQDWNGTLHDGRLGTMVARSNTHRTNCWHHPTAYEGDGDMMIAWCWHHPTAYENDGDMMIA